LAISLPPNCTIAIAAILPLPPQSFGGCAL
jgi:hypothetical protein